MNKVFLEARDIYKSYHLKNVEVPVLKGIDLTVHTGEWVALLGKSGSGKTTLLNALGILEKPDDGDINIIGESVLRFNKRKAAAFRRQNIGFIFQAYHLLPELTVFENVKLAGMINGECGSTLGERVNELLDKVELSHRRTHRPNELSGGEQQRVAIARAVINSPQLILADEPTGNLDSKTGAEVLDIFQKIHDPANPRTIIMVTHNQDIAKLADRIIYLKDGVVVDKL